MRICIYNLLATQLQGVAIISLRTFLCDMFNLQGWL